MGIPKKKFYAYVDESGQDTKGLIFVVSVLIVAEDRPPLESRLEAIEHRSGKGNVKWHKAKPAFRQIYIEEVSRLPSLRHSIFFERFSGSREYLELTAYATARAILKKAHGEYAVTVLVDGLKRQEIPAFTKGLRDLHIRTRKVRGGRRDENDAFIRLVDAICGLARDAGEGHVWAVEMLGRMKTAGLITEL